MSSYLLVFLGGGLGSVARFLVSKWMVVQPGQFPVATFTANAISSLLLGMLMWWVTATGNREGWRLLLAIGFCGGFSTFSTFSFEAFRLMSEGHHALAWSYMAVSVVVSLLLAGAGWWLMRMVTL